MTNVFIRACVVLAASVPLPVFPVSGTVVEGFQAPTCIRCAGHRGVTFATAPHSPVVAVRDGVVTFVGEVAHHTYVVVHIAPQVLVTYGWLVANPDLRTGMAIHQGTPLGVTGERFYLGVRVAGQYVEPLRYLGLLGVRLRGPGKVFVGQRPFAR